MGQVANALNWGFSIAISGKTDCMSKKRRQFEKNAKPMGRIGEIVGNSKKVA